MGKWEIVCMKGGFCLYVCVCVFCGFSRACLFDWSITYACVFVCVCVCACGCGIKRKCEIVRTV